MTDRVYIAGRDYPAEPIPAIVPLPFVFVRLLADVHLPAGEILSCRREGTGYVLSEGRTGSTSRGEIAPQNRS